MTGEAVKERARGKEDPSLLLRVLPLEEVFLRVSAAIRALSALDAVSCDTTSRNAVRKLQIQMQSHANIIILERKLKK